jgi:hypothetical protein
MLDSMKTLTTREFFHSPGLLKTLRPGQAVLVTDKGVPSFTVIKAGERPKKSVADLRREAKEIFPEKGPKVNFTEVMRNMKK